MRRAQVEERSGARPAGTATTEPSAPFPTAVVLSAGAAVLVLAVLIGGVLVARRRRGQRPG